MNSSEICKQSNIWVYGYGETLFNSLSWSWGLVGMKSLGCDVVHHSPIATMAVPLVMVAERERENAGES